MMNLFEMLTYVVDQKASDFHLSSGLAPFMRLDGRLQTFSDQVMAPEQVTELIYSILTEAQKQEFESKLELDFSFELPGKARFRVNLYHQNRGLSAAFRAIPTVIKSLDLLNMPHLKKFCDLPNGLILVTGPTGSGKSTTLAAMVDHINQHQSNHIVTIEDPIEFIHVSKNSIIHQREVYQHTLSFANALRAVLREDPDVILIGELRDLETIRLALTAAETGHVVLATLHTSSAAKTIDRVINVFPSDEQSMIRAMLSESLRVVISQILLQKIGGGRVAAQEIMVCDTAIRHLIRENKIPQMYSTIQTNQNKGMQTMDSQLHQLVKEQLVSKEEVFPYLFNKEL